MRTGVLNVVLPLVFILVVSAPGKAPAAEVRLEQAQRLFGQGDFDPALRALDAVVSDGGEPRTLARVHLLRGQIFAVRQDFVRAEEAFTRALESDARAELDPARVDPTIVKLLESVRSRLTGTLVAESTPVGAVVWLDGVEVGKTPLTLSVPVGNHTVEAGWADAPKQAANIVVRARQEARVQWLKTAGGPAAPPGFLVERPLRPFGELRGAFEPYVSGVLQGGLELGGGAELDFFRLGLWFRLYPVFRVTPRFQFALPVHEQVNVLLEVAVPFAVFPNFNVGLEGSGGAEWNPYRFFGMFVMFGGRHFFIGADADARTSFLLTGGVRLRLP